MTGNERSVVRPHDPDVGREQMDFQSNGSNNGANGDHETFGLTEATPVFNGTSNVKRVVADPGRENVLVLPAGVSLDDIDVQGDNLVIKLPDGTEMIVINGAIYVPEIVIDGVTVPPMNLAALLNAEAPEPAAGETRSSGGNFADPVDPIQPAYDIGDLLPYTELFFPQPEDQEIIPGLVNRVPEITFIPETGDGTVVDEDGLPVRDGETPGTRDQTDGETTTGTILYVSPDGTERLLIDGQDIFELNDQGEVVILEPFVTGYPLGNGLLVINSVDIETGAITYTYTLTDNTNGDNTFVEFEITVIDPQGDSDTGTARIDIIDDAPFTNNDGLLATLDDSAEGVVVGTVAQLLSNDEYGADGAGTPAIVIATGSLGGTISIVNGELVYTSNYNVAPGQSVTETFTYTIRDGDGDVSNTSTFTIILTDDGPTIGSGPDDIAAIIAVDEEGLEGGIAGGPENDLPGEATVINGTFAGFSYGGDGPGNVVLGGATYNEILTHAGNPVVTTWNNATHTLTGEDSVTGEDVFTIVLAVDENGKPTGEYTFTLLQPLNHADGNGENDLDLQVVATITDSEGDANTGVINITIDDDSPTISVDPRYQAGDVILDESPAGQDEDTDQTPADADAPAGRDSVDFDFTAAFEDGANFGADGPGTVTYALNLSANGVQSGLFALDVTDAATDDGDGYGQGEPILLYQVDGTTVIGYVGESPADGENYTTYFTITIDPDTGVGTFTQTENVWHADTTNDDDTSFLDIVDGDLFVEAAAIDFDNDQSAPAQLSIGHDVLQIQDDGPSLAISVIAESGEVNDDALVATTSDADLPDSDTSLSLTSFFSVTTANYGTDGEGTLSETYGLNILDSDTSLTSGGDPITLSYGPAVDGKVSVVGTADGDVVFTITVDTATGALTLEQSGPIDHAEGTDSTLLGAGVLEATYAVTITDADGDTESRNGSVDLGDNISFGDDVPTIVVDPEYVPADVILDESPAGQDEDTDQTPADADPPAGRDSVDFDFTAAFTDGTDYGNDVPGDTQYSLLLTSQNLASGLFALDVTDAATDDGDGYGQGEPILLYQVDATTVIGYVGESPADGENYTTYFTITIDPDTGVGTFTQTENVWHADTTNDDDTSFLDIVDGDLFVEAAAIDFDNDQSAPAQLSIGHDVLQIQDDGPSLAISVIAESGEVNDDALVATTSDADLPDSDTSLSLTSFFSVTTANYGTDGEGTLSETYGLNILDSDTSLTSGGDPITLSYGPAVDGKVSVVGTADGDVVFTITVDTATGALTLEQSGPIDHAEGTDSTLLGAGVLEATYAVTITDADGDTESRNGSVDLGDNISFGDDVPTIVVDPEYVPADVILDESPAGQDEDTDQTPADADPPAGRDSVDFDFTAAFTDGTDYGNDVPGDTQYSLLLTSQNLASGLFALDVTDAATDDGDGYGQGEPILLYQVDATTVIGYVGESPADGENYTTYFTITIDPDTGVGTFTQTENVWHADTTNDDDTSFLDIVDGDLFVEATAIDFDNDQSAPAQLSIGHDVLQIQDDGPSVNDASADTNGVSAADPGTAAEGNLLDNDNVGTDATGDFNGRVISISFDGDTDALGADGQGNLVLVTEYGTLTVEQDGSYSFALNADNPEVKALPSDQSLDIEFSYTFTDGDGDPESQTLTITIAGSNQPPTGAPKAVTVSEEGLVDADDNPIGNKDTTDDPYNVGSPAGQDDTNLATASGQFTFSDPDGDVLTYSIFAPTSTYYAADGSAIAWTSGTNLGVTTLTGKDGSGETVIVVTLDKTTGVYNVTLEGPVYHDPTPTTAPTTSGGLPVGDGNVESEFSITFGVTVADGIAPPVNTSLTVTIEDDSPIITENQGFEAPALVVDDTLLNSDSADFSGAFDISFGGDGEFDTFYSLNVSQQGAPSGLTETTSGLPIFLYQINGVVYGSTAVAIGSVDTATNTNVAFTISVDGDGNVTLDQIKPIVHDDDGDPVEAAPADAEQLTSAGLVTLTATAYDQDGDHQSATIDIGDAFFFEDDGPSITADTPSDSGVLITSDADITDTTTTDTTPPIASDATLNLATVFGYSGADYGNDGAGSITETYGLNITSGAATGLTSGGLAITLEYYDDGIAGTDSVRGVTSEGTVFTVQVNGTTGVVTLTQIEPLDHAPGTSQIGLPNGFLQATYEVEIVDGDGDTDSDSKSIDLGGNLLFNDDTPDINATGTAPSFVLDESALPAAGDGVYSVTKSLAANFTLNNTNKSAAGYGNDVPGSVSYALVLSTQNVMSGLYALDNTDTETGIDPVGQGEAIKLFQQPDGTVVGYTGNLAGTHTIYFTLEVDANTGDVTFEYANGIDPGNIWHANTGNDDDASAIQVAAGVLVLQATATDFDNDSDTATLDIGQGTFQIQDDGPDIVTPASDSTFSSTGSENYPLLATGTFGFDFGTDGMFGNSVDKAFSFDLVNGTVAGAAITNISDPVYDLNTGTWMFSFDYVDNNGATQTAHGFVDVAGNGVDYTVALDTNFEFTTVDQFSDVISRVGYNLTGNAASQYEIVVSQLDTEDPVFVQFQAYDGTLVAGANAVLVAGETVTGGETWASISNTENGVAGDTIQRGEVLDFDLFSTNPGGVYSDNGTVGADGLTLLLDGFGSEDLIVILKLEDADDPNITTTKILIVGQDDVFTNGDVIAGYNVTLDQNDGFIVIESNDFNSGSENWVITGAQLLSSSFGLSDTSTGILLNGAVGASGATTQTTVTFASAGTNDQDVVKITDIGLIRTVIDEQAVTLNFDVTVKDGDGDTETDSFTVNPIIPPVVLDLDGDGVELLSMAAGVTYDYGNGEVATAWAHSDDGILAHYEGGDFTAANFVFGDSERTDLEALAQDYDANHDGVLSGDELIGFGVWQDANSDGVFDDGEFTSLAGMGITEVSVTHSSAGYIAADGDAIVYGESTYTMDGKVYTLADVGFSTSTDYAGEGEPNQLRQAELALLAAAAPGLLVASALETTPFFADQHMVNFVPTDLTFDRAVSSVSLGQAHRGESHGMKFETLAKHEAPKAEDSAKLADNDDGNHHQSSQDLAPTAHEVADLGGSSEAAATFTAPSIPTGGSDMGGELMAALMQLGTKGEQPEGEGRGTAALDAVRAALHEVTGKDAISELVDHIVDNKPETAQHGHVGIDALNVLLNSGVAGQHFHAPVMADAADDAAHLAAAAAA